MCNAFHVRHPVDHNHFRGFELGSRFELVQARISPSEQRRSLVVEADAANRDRHADDAYICQHRDHKVPMPVENTRNFVFLVLNRVAFQYSVSDFGDDCRVVVNTIQKIGKRSFEDGQMPSRTHNVGE